MIGDHLWRLDDEIVPVHTHDDREVLIRRAADGTPEVFGSARAASEAACDHALGSDESGLGLAAEALGDSDSGRVSRRTVLGGLATLGALGAVSAQPRYAFAAPSSAAAATAAPRRDTLIVIFLRGASDGLQMVAPVADPAYRTARPGIALTAENTLRASSMFGFHPAMAPLMPLWSAKQLAVVHAVGNPDATRSHFDAQLDMERAAPVGVRSGWLGRHLAATSKSTDILRAVTLGDRAALSASAFPTASMSDLDSFDISGWSGYRRSIDSTLATMYSRAGGPVSRDAGRTFRAVGALATSRATKATTTGYPDDEFGRGLAEIARMMRAGAPVEAACIDHRDWDLHRNHGTPTEEWGPMRRNIDSLARGIAAFRADVGSLWRRTTVVTMSEFGRRVEENSTGGTDHGHGNVMLLAGGNVVGGKVHGRWPGLAASALHDGDLAVATDYRDVVGEILTRRLSTPNLAGVFPGHVYRPLGVVR